MPPSTAQWQKSHPLENDQRPRRRKPRSALSTVPVGASDVESWMLVSLPQTSSCASGAKRPRAIAPPARSPTSGRCKMTSAMRSERAGVDVEDPWQAIEACYDRGWTDGLPVVPPTEALVERMLSAGPWSPDHVLLFEPV